MAAYIVVRMKVDDPALLKAYQAATPAVIAQYKGRFIVRGGKTVTLEGPEESRRIVIIEFPTLADAEAFFHSPEYAEARKLRDDVSSAEFIAVEGIS
ncbi:MAG: DUF1330 domain-containing protein [Gammaproteobacteria bacterium]|nr:DUF1330 domain-containing protein [Gammaproteobacteria bacterium]